MTVEFGAAIARGWKCGQSFEVQDTGVTALRFETSDLLDFLVWNSEAGER